MSEDSFPPTFGPPGPPPREPNGRVISLLITLWLVVISGGAAVLFWYQSVPADTVAPPEEWPAQAGFPLAAEGFTLVVAAHPRCACTRATMAELERLESRLHGRIQVHVLFVKPEGTPDGFERTDLWRSAERMGSVTPHVDADGQLSAAFGARTSGAVMLFDAQGQLLFSGGITPSRGHEGTNVGTRRIVELVEKGGTDRNTANIFGCGLFDEDTL